MAAVVALSTAFCPPIEYFAVLAGYSSVFVDSGENYSKQSWRNRCRILSANGPLDLVVPVVHGGGRGITEVEVEYTTPWVAKMERAVYSAYDSSPFFEFYRDGLFGILDSRPATLWELNSRILEWLCARIGIAPPTSVAGAPPSGVRPAGSPHHPFGTVPPLPCRGWHAPQGEHPQHSGLASLAPAGEVGASEPVRSSAAHPSQAGAWAPPTYGAVGGTPPGGTPSPADLLDLRGAIHPKRPNTILRDMGLGAPYWQVFRERFGFTPGLSILDLLFNEGPDSILWLRR